MGPLAFSVGRVHDVVCTLRDLVQARAARRLYSCPARVRGTHRASRKSFRRGVD